MECELRVIPQMDDKYISFSQNIVVESYTDKYGVVKSISKELRFLDSYRFIPS